jgi:hypothetical protein
MPTIELGRLERVELRAIFPHEALAFTPWLAAETNLALLGDTIGLDLELEAQEKSVGPFSADILCKDTATEGWVLIENQIEKTDHRHLGQLLTYAAGLDAATVVWIAERFTDDHKAALDWLNDKTADRGVRFFGLEIELWRIGTSPVAPKFNIRAQPNDFTQGVRTAATLAASESEYKQLQLRFWTAFRKYMEDAKSTVGCQKASPQHWMTHSIGKYGFHLASIISSGKGNAGGDGPELRVEFIMRGQKRFKAVEEFKSEIENQLGMDLEWYNPSGNIQCKIIVRKPDDFSVEDAWPEQQKWLKDTLEKFKKTFVPIIMKLDHSALKE